MVSRARTFPATCHLSYDKPCPTQVLPHSLPLPPPPGVCCSIARTALKGTVRRHPETLLFFVICFNTFGKRPWQHKEKANVSDTKKKRGERERFSVRCLNRFE